MNNIEKLQDQLKCANKETKRLETAGDGLVIEIGISDCENLACFFRHFTIFCKEPLIIDTNIIEEKITYLSENLKLFELSKDLTILRSYPPLENEKSILYFEMGITPFSMTFSRYAYTKKLGNRVGVWSSLTNPTLNRLIEDFASIVQKE